MPSRAAGSVVKCGIGIGWSAAGWRQSRCGDLLGSSLLRYRSLLAPFFYRIHHQLATVNAAPAASEPMGAE